MTVRGGERALAANGEHRDLSPHTRPVYDLHQGVEDGAFLVLGSAVVFERVIEASGQDHQVRRLAQGRAPRERLDEREMVLFGIQPARGDDAREADTVGTQVALQRSPDVIPDLLFLLVAGRLVEDVQCNARWHGGETGVIGRVDGAPVGVVGVLVEALLGGARDVHARAVHRETFGHDTAGEVVAGVDLGDLGAWDPHLVHLLRAQRVGRKAEGDARSLLDQGRAESSVAVVGRDGVWQRTLGLVQIQQTRHELGAEVGPELLFGQERIRTAGDAQDAYVRGVRIRIGVRGELGPLGVHYPARHDVYPVTKVAHSERELLDVDELPAEIGVGGPVGIVRIEVALRVYEGDVHLLILSVVARWRTPPPCSNSSGAVVRRGLVAVRTRGGGRWDLPFAPLALLPLTAGGSFRPCAASCTAPGRVRGPGWRGLARPRGRRAGGAVGPRYRRGRGGPPGGRPFPRL